MRLGEGLLRQITFDLGLNIQFVKGQTIPVKNCWHFCTDGNAVDAMFLDEADFIAGMNRIFVVSKSYDIVILAFSLMDNHIHFVLYGSFGDSNRFVHEFLRRTSMHLMLKHGQKNKLVNIPVTHQPVENDAYLKVVICYTIKNAPAGGLPYNALDYPWSSGPLYFRTNATWSTPVWMLGLSILKGNILDKRDFLKSRDVPEGTIMTCGNLVFPGEYVAYEVVERLFRSYKGFNYFMCISKDAEVDSKAGYYSMLSMPIQEIRQHRKEISMEIYGVNEMSSLDIPMRMRIAKALLSRYNCSPKQVAKVCGLVYSEVKDLL